MTKNYIVMIYQHIFNSRVEHYKFKLLTINFTNLQLTTYFSTYSHNRYIEVTLNTSLITKF